MYVARRELILDDGRRVHHGERVDEAKDWPIQVLRAHLNLGFIVEVQEEELSSGSAREGESSLSEPVVLGAVTCEDCGRQFKSSRAYKTHARQKHR